MSVSAAATQLRRWREDPCAFVREVFGATPDAWQAEVLSAFPHSQRQAMKACKGPGKTTVEAWLAWNFLLTRPHPKIAATSITKENLADNLWTEMAKWQQRSDILKAAFDWTKTRIMARDHPETWWMSARSWARSADAEQQANTLAGLHADYIMFILDESGGIPDAVMVSADAALSSCIEGHILQAGNPTHLEGPLYRACTTERRLWHITEITGDPDDPRRSPRVKVEWARQQIEKYGKDNPWVLVNVFGRFPPASVNTLIGIEEVTQAMAREYRADEVRGMARVLGVDVALYGDDSSVICPRQGLICFPMIQLRNVDGPTGAGAVARKWQDFEADACFVDNTGGFGSSWIDQLRLLNRQAIPVHFAGEPLDQRYYNKRAEMYFEAVAWIKAGGWLPNIPELGAALSRTTYTFKGDRLLLEDKAQVKEKLGYSPDHADAFALTFAFPVTAAQHEHPAWVKPKHQIDYNPYAEGYQLPGGGQRQPQRGTWMPGRGHT